MGSSSKGETILPRDPLPALRAPFQERCYGNPSALGTPGSLVQPLNRNKPLSGALGAAASMSLRWDVPVQAMRSLPGGPRGGASSGPTGGCGCPRGPTR